MLNLDYVEVEIRQAKSKYKIRETGSIILHSQQGQTVYSML